MALATEESDEDATQNLCHCTHTEDASSGRESHVQHTGAAAVDAQAETLCPTRG